MKKDLTTNGRRSLWLSLAALGMIGTLIALPLNSSTQAFSTKNDDGSQITRSHTSGFENYDIRQDKQAADKLDSFRSAGNKNAVSIAAARQQMIAGEDLLRTRVPSLKVEYNEDLRIPEVIAPDVKQGKHFLTAAGGSRHSEILRQFVKENGDLVGLSSPQADDLRVTADYTNPDGNLSFAHLEQFINGVPVFRGEVKAGFTKNGEMIRVINNLAPGLEYSSLSSDFGDPANAVRFAFKNVTRAISADDTQVNAAASDNLKTTFGTSDWATTAEKMYFPVDAGVARAAWRVLVWEPVAAYYVIVDAETGTMLWRKNITEDQTQAATYNVYSNTTSLVGVLDSPAPITPGPTNPSTGTQGTQVGRTNVTLIGNEAPNTFNNLGWITDGNNSTDGNAVEAGVDLATPNGVDAPTIGSSNRVFSYNYNPPPGLGGTTPDAITTTDSRNGAVTQLFYINNRYHDELYKLGFTEAARNFQNDNFGRGGAGADRVSAEAQDSSGTNNANFATPADGGRGRMQMYRFTQTPNRDGDLDGDIVIHEHTHGLSNRLHGNGSGLGTSMSGGMGEGWSDFYGLALQSEPTDAIDGVYSTGAYATFNAFGIGTTNSYYGIRRFPYAVRTAVGGPSNRPYNPLTFADIDSAQANISDGAYAASPPFAGSAANEVHNAGEVWCITLYEVRANYMRRLGSAVGNRRILQFVTDGMKLAPLNPTMIQERDAIIAAAQASGTGADVADIWAGFATRGMGFSARVVNASSSTVVEAFDPPNVVQTPNFTFAITTGNGNAFPEPGETLALTIPITNNTGATVTGVSLQVNGGAAVSYGDIPNAATVSRTVNYVIPAGTPCGSELTLTFNIVSSSGTRVETRTIRIGTPTFSGTTQNFDSLTVPAVPAGWDKTQSGSITNGWVTTTTTPSSAPNALFAADPATEGYADIAIPANITSSAANISFKLNYNTESTWDGSALFIKVGNGNFQDIIEAGGSFVSGNYPRSFDAQAGHLLSGKPGWTGSSAGYVNVSVNLPASANGQNVTFKLIAVADTSVSGVGTFVDDVQLTGGALFSSYTCSNTPPPAKTAFDFDGDAKADLSVFRPSTGIWYLQRSTAGFVGTQHGQNGDLVAPADFDGDAKTDLAVFRPSTGFWYRINSATSTFVATQFGQSGDAPRPADFDGDGKADLAVFRPSNGAWYRSLSGTGTVTTTQFGQSGDIAAAVDFDGDAKADLAVFRPSNGTWYRLPSLTGTQTGTQFGQSGDIPNAADFDGDGKADLAVFRPSTGIWYRLNSTTGTQVGTQFGQSGDVPTAADYDGDGKADLSVFRPSTGFWYRTNSNGGSFFQFQFGQNGDAAAPGAFNQ